MNTHESRQKVKHSATEKASRKPDGRDGLSVAPPRYGVAFVDAQAGVVQREKSATASPASVKPNESGLPDGLQAGIEQLSGYLMRDVRVHYNSSKPAQLQALAYTQGTDIHVAPGQERHLPHEAWHVVQQKQGRVKPTMQMRGEFKVNDDGGLEREADQMGQRALRFKALTGEQAQHDRIESWRHTSTALVKTDVLQKKGDVVEDIVLEGYKKNKKKLKATLAGCVDKFREAINHALEDAEEHEENKAVLREELSEDGRDAPFYRKFWWKNERGLLGDIDRWASSWSVARTGGLLADLGLALKNVPMAVFTGGLDFDEITNKEYLQKGSNHVRGRGPTSSDWSDDIEKSGIKGNAGPSSTTTQLLHVASSLGVFSDVEVQAMMVALVKFWKQPIKRTFGGGYHTAVEVWAPYTGYLEAHGGQDEED